MKLKLNVRCFDKTTKILNESQALTQDYFDRSFEVRIAEAMQRVTALQQIGGKVKLAINSFQNFY